MHTPLDIVINDSERILSKSGIIYKEHEQELSSRSIYFTVDDPDQAHSMNKPAQTPMGRITSRPVNCLDISREKAQNPL